MIYKLLILLFVTLSSMCLLGQSSDEETTNQKTYLLYGIYLEDSKVTIPWGTSFEMLKQYGNPRIEIRDRRIIIWDSVKLFDGITASIKFNSKRVSALNYVNILFDSANAEKARLYLHFHFGDPAKVRSNRKRTYTEAIWKINNMFIIFSQWKDYPNSNKLYIQKPR